MKITALEEYGIRCMLALARNWPEKSVTMPELSVSEGLSVPYVGKLMMILKQANLVKAARGRKGGYKLIDAPDKIHLDTIFKALGEPIYTAKHCEKYSGDNETCVHMDDCTVRHMWESFNDFISGILHNLTLADLLNGNYQLVIPPRRDEKNSDEDEGYERMEPLRRVTAEPVRDMSRIQSFK